MHINLKLEVKPLTKAIPTDNDGSAKENSSKHDDVEVDSTTILRQLTMPMMKMREFRELLNGLSGHRRQITGTSMFNDAAYKFEKKRCQAR